MSKEEAIKVTATVLETLPNAMFKVAVDENQHEVLAGLSPCDLKRGRNMYRYK